MRPSSKSIRRALAILAISILFVQLAPCQVKKRSIACPQKQPDDLDDALLEIVEIRLAGNRLTAGESFDADENWLKGLTLKVKNIGKKPIASFGVTASLLQGVNEEPGASASSEYGAAWNWGKVVEPHSKRPKGPLFDPGAIVELTYSDFDPLVRKTLSKPGEGKFCKLQFNAPSIQYDDGIIEAFPRLKVCSK